MSLLFEYLSSLTQEHPGRLSKDVVQGPDKKSDDFVNNILTTSELAVNIY